jgi:hypothetical protein
LFTASRKPAAGEIFLTCANRNRLFPRCQWERNLFSALDSGSYAHLARSENPAGIAAAKRAATQAHSGFGSSAA